MAYSIDELISEIDEDEDGIGQLEAIIDQCQRKISSILAACEKRRSQCSFEPGCFDRDDYI